VTTPIQLLYAEDNPLDADLTRAHFEREAPDFALELVDSGSRCLARLRAGPCDVLLLDNHLPDMDGIDVLRALGARDPSVPVVMVTGAGDEELVVQALRSGAVDYIPKVGDYLVRLPAVLRRVVDDRLRETSLGPAIRAERRRVLYVEPNPMDRELTATRLAALGPHLALTTVATPAEALGLLARDPAFDLVLTDLRTPGMSALEFLREARQRGLEVPCIVVTGQGDEEAAVAALRLGAYDYLVKREGYLTQLPSSIDNAIHRVELARLADRQRQELLELNRSLEDQVRARTATLEREVLERQRAEAQLRQSQKLEALGSIAGGVAHDFNNILTVFQANAAALLELEGQTVEGAALAREIQDASQRAAALTRQLLQFSRRQPLEPRNLDLNGALRGTTRMLQRVLGADIAISTEYGEGLPPVRVDPALLDQILLNLAVNARDAMPEGGRLALETAVEHLGAERLVGYPDAAPGAFVRLTFRDTGAGISEENLLHVFEPFFTTKEAGKGTGLGMATVYGVVRQHRGLIEVGSQPGQGTAVTIWLPAAEGEVAAEPPPADEEAPRGSEGILVVEDEAVILRRMGTYLQGLGYRVWTAASGPAALDLWKEHRGEIQLLLTDVTMPGGMSGLDVAERLWRDRPELPVVFTSGNAAAVGGRGRPLEDGRSFLQKPYQPSALARLLRKHLDPG
jgi:CheY-like chemotaxis protein